MFIALEVLSLPLYLICGLARRRRLLSQEAAVKYFLLGAFASAFFLYGLALVYGYAGRVDLARSSPRRRQAQGNDAAAVLGLALLVVGLLFKVGAAPFHTWTPDVYQGAPTAGHRASWPPAPRSPPSARILRLLYVGFATARWNWRPLISAIAIVSMVVGAVARPDPDRRQADARLLLDRARRLPAHRRHRPRPRTGLSATLFYLLAYGLTTIGVLRRRHPGPRRRRRGHPPVRSGPGWRRKSPADRRRLRLPAVRPRRHPAHQRLHRQVRGLPGGDRAAPGRWWSSALVASAIDGVLLPAGRRAHVLLRAGRRTGRRSPCPRPAPPRHRARRDRDGHPGAGRRPGPVLDLADQAALFTR